MIRTSAYSKFPSYVITNTNRVGRKLDSLDEEPEFIKALTSQESVYKNGQHYSPYSVDPDEESKSPEFLVKLRTAAAKATNGDEHMTFDTDHSQLIGMQP